MLDARDLGQQFLDDGLGYKGMAMGESTVAVLLDDRVELTIEQLDGSWQAASQVLDDYPSEPDTPMGWSVDFTTLDDTELMLAGALNMNESGIANGFTVLFEFDPTLRRWDERQVFEHSPYDLSIDGAGFVVVVDGDDGSSPYYTYFYVLDEDDEDGRFIFQQNVTDFEGVEGVWLDTENGIVAKHSLPSTEKYVNVWVRDENDVWEFSAQLQPPDYDEIEFSEDYFSLAVAEGQVILGYPWWNPADGGTGGGMWVWEQRANTWTVVQDLSREYVSSDDDAQLESSFGSAVAVTGSYMVVSGGSLYSYVYIRQVDGEWVEYFRERLFNCCDGEFNGVNSRGDLAFTDTTSATSEVQLWLNNCGWWEWLLTPGGLFLVGFITLFAGGCAAGAFLCIRISRNRREAQKFDNRY